MCRGKSRCVRMLCCTGTCSESRGIVVTQRRRGAKQYGIVLGALGSAVGSVATGNTGGPEVSIFKRMPIAPELLSIMQGSAPDIPVKVDGTNGT